MKYSILEVILGFIVLLVFSLCLYLAAENKGGVKGKTYSIQASFADASGLDLGSEVKISGVSIGKVTSFELDKNAYNAIVTMAVAHNVKIPTDSSARILSDGLLGEKFIAINAGIEEEFLPVDGMITFTQSTLGLEELLSKYLFGLSNDKSTAKASN